MSNQTIINRALRMLGVVDAGSAPTATQGEQALEALQSLVLALPNTNRWTDVDVTEDYTAGENERIRATTTDALTITIPVSVASGDRLLDRCGNVTLVCSAADRAPRELARVQITDALSDTTYTYYYRSDLAQWTRVDALTLTGESALSAIFDMGLSAMLAVVLADEYGAAPSAVTGEMAGRFERTLWQLNPPDLLFAPDRALRRKSYERIQ